MTEEATIPEWAEGLSDDLAVLKESPYLSDSATPQAFVDQIKNAANHQGNSIRIPGPDATPETMTEFHEKILTKVPDLVRKPNLEDPDSVTGMLRALGTPEAADGYKLPDGLEVSDEAAKTFREQAHSLSLTQQQFANWVNAAVEGGQRAEEASAAALEQSMASLKEDWGIAFEDRMTEVANFLQTSKDVPQDIAAAFQNKTLDGGTVKWLHNLAVLGSEPGQSDMQGDGGSKTLTTAECTERAQEAIQKANERESDLSPVQKERLMQKALQYNQMAAGLIPFRDLG